MAEPNTEKFFHGQFSLTPEEIENAKKEGNLPEMEEKMKQATKHRREKQAQKAVEELEKSLEK